jgi:hypothetical protein
MFPVVPVYPLTLIHSLDGTMVSYLRIFVNKNVTKDTSGNL